MHLFLPSAVALCVTFVGGGICRGNPGFSFWVFGFSIYISR